MAIFFARFGSPAATTEAATQLLGFERRQVFRLLKAHRTEGATGLVMPGYASALTNLAAGAENNSNLSPE